MHTFIRTAVRPLKRGLATNLKAQHVFIPGANQSTQIIPPSYFQDRSRLPSPMTETETDIPQKHAFFKSQSFQPMEPTAVKSGEHIRSISIFILSSLLVLNGTLMYRLSESKSQIFASQDEMKRKLMESKISQSIMAVHIGLLKKQLLDQNAIPVSSSQALVMSSRILDVKDDAKQEEEENSIGMKLNNSYSRSILPQLIPQNSDYDPSRIFKY